MKKEAEKKLKKCTSAVVDTLYTDWYNDKKAE